MNLRYSSLCGEEPGLCELMTWPETRDVASIANIKQRVEIRGNITYLLT
jgi:hypothetical protein